jgi:hypothetical protein
MHHGPRPLALVAGLAAATAFAAPSAELAPTDAAVVVHWDQEQAHLDPLLIDGGPVTDEAKVVRKVEQERLGWAQAEARRGDLTARRGVATGSGLVVVVDRLEGTGVHFVEATWVVSPGLVMTPLGGVEWDRRPTPGATVWRAFVELPRTFAWLLTSSPVTADAQTDDVGRLTVALHQGQGSTRLGFDLAASGHELGLGPTARLVGVAGLAADDGTVAAVEGVLTDPEGKLLAAQRQWPVDLSSGWHFRLDPGRRGVIERWMRPDFDDSAWSPLDAGVTWEAGGHPAYDGVAWYRRSIEIPLEARADGAELRFDGIDDDATIWVDGEPVVQSSGWQTDVVVPLPPGRAEVCVAICVVDTGGAGGLYTKALLHLKPPPPTTEAPAEP